MIPSRTACDRLPGAGGLQVRHPRRGAWPLPAPSVAAVPRRVDATGSGAWDGAMPHSPLARLLLICAPLAACQTSSSTSADVRALVERQQSTWNQGDVEGFLKLGYWNSPALTFYSGGEVVRGFDTV